MSEFVTKIIVNSEEKELNLFNTKIATIEKEDYYYSLDIDAFLEKELNQCYTLEGEETDGNTFPYIKKEEKPSYEGTGYKLNLVSGRTSYQSPISVDLNKNTNWKCDIVENGGSTSSGLTSDYFANGYVLVEEGKRTFYYNLNEGIFKFVTNKQEKITQNDGQVFVVGNRIYARPKELNSVSIEGKTFGEVDRQYQNRIFNPSISNLIGAIAVSYIDTTGSSGSKYVIKILDFKNNRILTLEGSQEDTINFNNATIQNIVLETPNS